jgi:hypothetical protein
MAEVRGDSMAEVRGDSMAEVRGDSMAEVRGDSMAEVRGDSMAEVRGDVALASGREGPLKGPVGVVPVMGGLWLLLMKSLRLPSNPPPRSY